MTPCKTKSSFGSAMSVTSPHHKNHVQLLVSQSFRWMFDIDNHVQSCTIMYNHVQSCTTVGFTKRSVDV